MNILITGAKGFIGSHLVSHIGNAHNVTTYDLKDGQDIRNLHDLDTAFEYAQCSTVVHLAARAGVRRSISYPGEYITTNIEGTWNVGKMCEKYNCRLINFSSSSVYGNGTPPLSEGDIKKPISLYGMTKLCAERIVDELTIPTITLRPFTVYGLNGRGDQVFYKWLNQFYSGKDVTVFMNDKSCRGYTYVNDLVDLVYKLCMRKWLEPHQDFNIGGSEIITIQNLATIFSSLVPGFSKRVVYINAPKEDIRANYADITKARKLLGYKPRENFEANLCDIIMKYIGSRHGSL